ncbi:AfsR/SARP family transcriptional regulator [Streptomyces alkaliphilus]|uniref:AfsR/SARP family transcriptional regulator n=1 Tax=Streptomyces alkaliphilus TaxID=1472722 RepID=UPI001E28AA7C|nr:AfsR/SARP family transcriptional regulator [Streptomyces alkaliphilus]
MQIAIDGKPVRVGRNRQLTVLAILLLNANKVVPVSTLIDAVWRSSPPATADKQIQTCVWRLRNSFTAAGGPADLIETDQGGYRIRLSDDDLDARAFEKAVRGARDLAAAGDLESALAEYQRALSLFRGQPLADLPGPLTYGIAAHWEERRFSVLEEWLDIGLAFGRHSELIGELKPLVAEYPMRERLCAQLMTALYLSQRRAEALAVYRNSRITLINKLGLEPGARLQELHQQILAGEPIDTPLIPQRRVHHTAKTPAQLPARAQDFTGRRDLLPKIASDLRGEGGARVVALTGCGGSGKTALAVQVGHDLHQYFPDGQLYADLHGQTSPVPPHEVLCGFLDALGVPEQRVPAGLAARAALFRSVSATKRLLIVLDDLAESIRYETLLPSGDSAVLCTARASPLKIPGLVEYRMGGLPADDALDLLASLVGTERVFTEVESARRIIQACGRLPLAIRAAGARLRARPHCSLRAFADRLTTHRSRIAELTIGPLDIGARLATSLDQLSPACRHLWMRLGLCHLEHLPEWAASTLSDLPAEETQRLLDILVNQHLLTVAPGDPVNGPTYTFNSLIRDHARRYGEKELGSSATEDVTHRLSHAARRWRASAGHADSHRKNEGATVHGARAV